MRTRHHALGLGYWVRDARVASIRRKPQDLPGSRTDPCACTPRSSTPPDHRSLASNATDNVAFRSENHVGSGISSLSRLNHFGSHAPCVRFAATVTREPRNTRFRLVASLGRTGLSPVGSAIESFRPARLSTHIPSSFTGLGLAQFQRQRAARVALNTLGPLRSLRSLRSPRSLRSR